MDDPGSVVNQNMKALRSSFLVLKCNFRFYPPKTEICNIGGVNNKIDRDRKMFFTWKIEKYFVNTLKASKMSENVQKIENIVEINV